MIPYPPVTPAARRLMRTSGVGKPSGPEVTTQNAFGIVRGKGGGRDLTAAPAAAAGRRTPPGSFVFVFTQSQRSITSPSAAAAKGPHSAGVFSPDCGCGASVSRGSSGGVFPRNFQFYSSPGDASGEKPPHCSPRCHSGSSKFSSWRSALIGCVVPTWQRLIGRYRHQPCLFEDDQRGK